MRPNCADEQRQWWREVSEALLVGRRENLDNQGFGRWCEDRGFGDLDGRDRTDALWLAENWAALTDHPSTTGHSHPHAIRAWFRDNPLELPGLPSTGEATQAPSVPVTLIKSLRPLLLPGLNSASGPSVPQDHSSWRTPHPT